MAASGLILSACTPSSKAYPGPLLKPAEVGVIAPPGAYSRKSIAILAINGQDRLDEWKGGKPVNVHLLPGEYQFRVELKQSSPVTTIPILDLILLLQDAAAAAAHGETNIEFPVRAETTHRLHYDESSHVFSVSLFPGAARIHGLEPTKDAVACVENPDEHEDFWCRLIPPAP
jgi:hypothetical protein